MKVRKEIVVLGIVIWFCMSAVVFFNRFETADRQFVWLAGSFLAGRLDLPRGPVDAYSLMDVTVRGGAYYWPLGPLPAVVLAPLVALFGEAARLPAVLQLWLATAMAALSYALARRTGASAVDAAWMAVAFCAGSVAFGTLAMHGPWQVGHALVLALSLVALIEHRGKDRPEAIGALIGLALASRLTAVVMLAYFGFETLFRTESLKRRFARLLRMAAPVTLVLVLLGAYNAARFGSPFDNGYVDSHLTVGALDERRERGLFSPENVSRNAWYYFLALPSVKDGRPTVDHEGMSFFAVSPIFLLAFLPPSGDRRRWLAGMLAFVAALVIFLPYYTTGFRQFGPRYLNDVLPALYLLLLGRFAVRAPGRGTKIVIAVSAVVNVLLFWYYFLPFIS